MNTINFLQDQGDFLPLWQRATAAVEALRDRPSTDLLYFDAIDLQTQKFFDLIQHLLASTGATDFATLVLKPNPFSYFHFHFGKYPGFVHRSRNTDDEFFQFLLEDPGDSPADALGSNSQQYVVLPLPGDWLVFGDRWWETAVLAGPQDIMERAKRFYPFFLDPPDRFRIEL